MVKRPSQGEGLDRRRGPLSDRVEGRNRREDTLETRDREEAARTAEEQEHGPQATGKRRQDRERYQTKPETTSMETRGRVEDNVWTRAIIEETLGNVEGRQEIFQPRSLSFPRVKLTMRFEQRKSVTNRPSREHFEIHDNGSI